MWSSVSPSPISNTASSSSSHQNTDSLYSPDERENVPPSNLLSTKDVNASYSKSDVQRRARKVAKRSRNNHIEFKKEGLSDFARSFYENTDSGSLLEEDGEEMRKSRRIAGVSSAKSSGKRGVPKKTPKRKAVKRSQATDDSIMIVSPNTNPAEWSSPGFSGSGNVYGGQLKRMRLFPTPKKENPRINETIDLVDDDEYDTVDSDDVILLDEVKSSGTSTVNQTENDDDIEIVGVRVVPPQNNRLMGRNSLRNSPRNNFTFQEVKQAVKRAKRRMSSLNVSRTLVTSRNIKKKKKQMPKKNKEPHQPVNNPVSQQRKKARVQNRRRSTRPIYVLDKELGPNNPNWNSGRGPQSKRSRPFAAEFIPISSVNVNRGPIPHVPCSSTGNSGSETDGTSGSNLSPTSEAFNLMVAPGNIVPQRLPGTHRPIIIDASNVAMGHGRNLFFSCRGIRICVDYFKRRGHQEIIAFVPRFRCRNTESVEPQILTELEREGVLKFTPSREAGGERISSYDDRYIVQYASEVQGIIISNDNYRDLYDQQDDWREQITLRILQFTWITEHCIMFPWDPLGRKGPTLDAFLRF